MRRKPVLARVHPIDEDTIPDVCGTLERARVASFQGTIFYQKVLASGMRQRPEL